MGFEKRNGVSLTFIGVFATNIMILGFVYLSYNLFHQKEIIASQNEELKELRRDSQRMKLMGQEILKVVEEAEQLNVAITMVEGERLELGQEIVSLQDELVVKEENIQRQQERFKEMESRLSEQEKEIHRVEAERRMVPQY